MIITRVSHTPGHVAHGLLETVAIENSDFVEFDSVRLALLRGFGHVNFPDGPQITLVA